MIKKILFLILIFMLVSCSNQSIKNNQNNSQIMCEYDNWQCYTFYAIEEKNMSLCEVIQLELDFDPYVESCYVNFIENIDISDCDKQLGNITFMHTTFNVTDLVLYNKTTYYNETFTQKYSVYCHDLYLKINN